jgi:hypothetical protein
MTFSVEWSPSSREVAWVPVEAATAPAAARLVAEEWDLPAGTTLIVSRDGGPRRKIIINRRFRA